MKNSLMSIEDKILLRKRASIETVNDELKFVKRQATYIAPNYIELTLNYSKQPIRTHFICLSVRNSLTLNPEIQT